MERHKCRSAGRAKAFILNGHPEEPVVRKRCNLDEGSRGQFQDLWRFVWLRDPSLRSG
jgi:hypothetical protein